MKKLTAIVFLMGVLAGCANQSDITTLQVQVDYLKDKTTQTAKVAEEAKVEAQNASASASAAQQAAETAEAAIKAVNDRVDTLLVE